MRTVPLRPLSAAEVAEFAQWVRRGLPPDPADVLRWHAQTEGNPLFVEQLVRSTTGVGVRPAPVALGGTVDLNEILLGHVRQLGEAEHRTLTYAALLGKEFAFSNLVAISEMDEERVTESLDRLVAGGLLREKGNEVCEFVTEGVRAGVYAELTETRRRILHRRVGRSLEERGLASEFELARQFYLGRDDAKAAEYNLRAAVIAMRSFAFETAVPHLERALEAERRRPDRSPAREIHVMIDLGRAFDELGDLRHSEVALSDAVLLARTRPELDPELGRALLALAQTRAGPERVPVGRGPGPGGVRATRTRRHSPGGHDRPPGARRRLLAARPPSRRRAASPSRARDCRARGDPRRAWPCARGRREHDAAPRPGAVPPSPRALREGGGAVWFRTGPVRARSRADEPRGAAQLVGRPDDAIRGIEQAIEAAERSRSPIWMGYCYLNLAQMQAELGHAEPARPALERAATLLLPLGDRLAPEQIALARGLLAEAEKDYDGAETHFADALHQAHELNSEPEVCELLFRLAHVAYSRGDLPSARAKLAAAREAGLDASRSDLAARVAALDAALAPPE